ncbi:MAG: hypothetical protein ACLUI3_04130 [Christensenellales bacterium]
MGYWSYSALDGCNGQMILGYMPQKTLAPVKACPPSSMIPTTRVTSI